MRIFKFALPLYGNSTIFIQENAEILHVGEQNGELWVWALINMNNKLVNYEFKIFGTGQDCNLSPDARFIGTVQMSNGLVFHVFL